MALIAACDQPYPDLTDVDHVPQAEAQRFPVPISVTASMYDVPDTWALDEVEEGVATTLSAALSIEATHLEPNIGQIWPR